VLFDFVRLSVHPPVPDVSVSPLGLDVPQNRGGMHYEPGCPYGDASQA
jgi:hypothetical protein